MKMKPLNYFQILSLYAFILTALYEKLQTSSKIKPKKKSNSETELVISEKERCQMLIELMRLLKKEFQRCDKLISKYFINNNKRKDGLIPGNDASNPGIIN